MTLTKIKPAGLSKPIDLADNERIRLGTGTDLQIYHDGTNSFIKDTAGASFSIAATESIAIKTNNTEFAIACNKDGSVELYHNGNKKFNTASDGGTLTGNLFVSEALQLNDSKKIELGNSADLQLFHNSSNTSSYVSHDNASGYLFLQGDAIQLRTRDATNNDIYVSCSQGGPVQLYHGGTKRFETSSNGVLISGFTDVRQDSTGAYATNAGPGNVLARFYNGSTQDNSHAAIQLRASNDNAAADMWWMTCVSQSQNYNGFLAFTGRTTSSASTELVRFSNNGDVSINAGDLSFASGKGIDFSAVSDGSRTVFSNILHDYEEGTWTPTIRGSTSTGTATYTSQRGNYVKVGKKVTVSFYVTWSSFNGTGILEFDGLPFSTWNNNQVQHAGPVMTLNLTYPSNVVNVVTHNWYGVSYFRLYGSYSGGGWDAIQCDNSAGVIGTLTYFSND